MTAKVIQDSICQDTRLTTYLLEFPMTLMREFNTHRSLSRNASSSRAIPLVKTVAEVMENPVIPIYWGKNQPGMQSYEELPLETRDAALKVWLEARDAAVKYASQLSELGLHKQYANLLLDPFAWIRVVATGTDWDNFFALRDHEAAKPEIQQLARDMKEALSKSTPTRRLVHTPETAEHNETWHLPFITAMERVEFSVQDLIKMSVARCARVSYNKHDGGNSTLEEDERLYTRLLLESPPHASPGEHQASFRDKTQRFANLQGWKSTRSVLGV